MNEEMGAGRGQENRMGKRKAGRGREGVLEYLAGPCLRPCCHLCGDLIPGQTQLHARLGLVGACAGEQAP